MDNAIKQAFKPQLLIAIVSEVLHYLYSGRICFYSIKRGGDTFKIKSMLDVSDTFNINEFIEGRILLAYVQSEKMKDYKILKYIYPS